MLDPHPIQSPMCLGYFLGDEMKTLQELFTEAVDLTILETIAWEGDATRMDVLVNKVEVLNKAFREPFDGLEFEIFAYERVTNLVSGRGLGQHAWLGVKTFSFDLRTKNYDQLTVGRIRALYRNQFDTQV